MKWIINFTRKGYFCTFCCMAKDTFEAYEKFHRAFPGVRIILVSRDSSYKKSQVPCIR